MPAKIKLTDEERTDVVDLYAIGYSTPRVIDHLLSTHPDWQHAERHQIRTAIRTCNPNHEKCSKKWKLRFEDTKRHFHKHRDRLIETAAGHAAELTFDVLLQLSEILKSAKNSLADPGVNKDTIAYMRTLLDIYKVMNPIANPSETDGNPTSNPKNYEDLKHRVAAQKKLQNENSASVPSAAVVEDKSLEADSDENEGEYHGHSNGA